MAHRIVAESAVEALVTRSGGNRPRVDEVIVPGPAWDVEGKSIAQLDAAIGAGRVGERRVDPNRRADARERRAEVQIVRARGLRQGAAAARDRSPERGRRAAP